MNQKAKITAAKKAYELDKDGNLWTTPRGSRPVTQDAVLVIVDGLAYRMETSAIINALKPKRKKQANQKTGCTKIKQLEGE